MNANISGHFVPIRSNMLQVVVSRFTLVYSAYLSRAIVFSQPPIPKHCIAFLGSGLYGQQHTHTDQAMVTNATDLDGTGSLYKVRCFLDDCCKLDVFKADRYTLIEILTISALSKYFSISLLRWYQGLYTD